MDPSDVTSIDVGYDEHDLQYPIDYREKAEAAFPLESMATDTVTEAIALKREKAIADMAQNAANYGSSNKIALSGTSCFSDKVNSDPTGVITDGKEAVRQKIGRKPNTAVIGAQAIVITSYSIHYTKLYEKWPAPCNRRAWAPTKWTSGVRRCWGSSDGCSHGPHEGHAAHRRMRNNFV